MTKILILGGGFGGVRVALDLERRLCKQCDVEITLLDHHTHHTFTPSLYEMVTAYPPEALQTELAEIVAIPYEEIFVGTRVHFRQTHIEGINLGGRIVKTKGADFAYDYLVLALGGVANTFGIPGLSEHAISLHSLEEAFRIRQRVCEVVTKKGDINIVIGGAGPTGVGLACELRRFTTRLAHACHHDSKMIRIILLEALADILPGQSSGVQKVVRRTLNQCGIEVMTECALAEVREGVVVTNRKTLAANILIWSGGVRAHPLVTDLEGGEKDKKGRLIVDLTMAAKRFERVWAIGDCASVVAKGETRAWPELAYLAIAQGQVAAANIACLIGNKKPTAFVESRPLIFVLPLGGRRALYVGPRLVFDGFLGWLVSTAISLHYLSTILPGSRALKRWWRSLHVFRKND